MDQYGQKIKVRTLDDLGRIVIPSDVRDTLSWTPGVRLEMFYSESARAVVIREEVVRCSLCREESDSLMRIAGGFVCVKCAIVIIEELKK